MTLTEEDTFNKLRKPPINQMMELVREHKGCFNSGVDPFTESLKGLITRHGWTVQEYKEARSERLSRK